MANIPEGTPKPTHAYLAPIDELGRPVVMGRPVPPPKKDGWRSVVSTIGILLAAPLVALLLTMFVFQSYQVDGASMQPTLHNNDRLIVWKLPRTLAKIFHGQYVPHRGDIVVFTEPDLESYGQSPDKQLIKRVIALPGERVVVKDGTIKVYNDESPDGFKPDDLLPYGKTIPSTAHDGEWVVGEKQLFVSGDNRPESLDSRYFGPIDLSNVIGKLSFRVLPVGQAKHF
jgi:signal peptidase I